MKNISTKSLVQSFKDDFQESESVTLDFRKHKFLDNQYNNSPCFSYNFAEDIVVYLYNWAHNFIEENEENYPHFQGWEYNTSMTIESLRVTKLKTLIEDVCSDLYMHHVEEYRKEGDKVFKYSRETKAYMFNHVEN